MTSWLAWLPKINLDCRAWQSRLGKVRTWLLMALGKVLTWLLIALGLTTAIVCLVTYQVRARIASVSIAEQTYSPWRILRIVNEKPAFERNIRVELDKLPEVRQANRNVEDARARLNAALKSFADSYKASKGTGAQMPTVKDTGNKAIAALKKALESLAGDSAELKKHIDEIDKELKTIKENNDLSLRRRDELIDKTRNEQAARLIGVDASTFEKMKVAERERARDLIEEVTTLSDTNVKEYRPFRYLLVMPHELLLFLIVGGLGIVGRGIGGMREFGASEPRRGVHKSVLDSLLGGLVAAVLYIVFKAGVLIFVDPRTSTATFTDLNPFLVAFMGLVGGLLSEGVINRIRRLGEKWLDDPGSVGVDRWSPHLKEVLGQRKLTKDQWLVFEPSDADEFDDWVSVKRKVPSVRQGPLARWLNTPEHMLFTDVGPALPMKKG